MMDGFLEWALAFLVVASLPFSGHDIGYTSYRLLRRHQDSVAHFVGVVIPPFGFFYHLKWLIEPDGFSRGEMIFAAGGTALQLLLSLALQLALHNRHKLKTESRGGAA